jgi:epoxyqueuosine reductase
MDNHYLEQTAVQQGASFFGIADLAPASKQILEQGGEEIARFPRAISIGIALQHSLVDPLHAQLDKQVILNYRHLAYDAVNLRLDQIALHLSGMLQSAGFRSRPVPASQTIDHDRRIGIFSNKMAASLAGLGWIGKSCLLVTPEAGPRVRWATVLTNASLEPTGEMMAQRCGTCRDCVDICPAQAFTGAPFNPDEPRSVRFDVHKCAAYFEKREREFGYSTCGLCLYVCPHGKKASARLQ